ncbi:hypothetical protein LINPERHAP1_LOCUS34406 [Linum perenne]
MTRYWRRGWVPDLNHLPPVDDPSLDGLIGFSILPDSGPQSAAFTCRRPPHLEIIDDEVALISPRAFAQAKCSSTRNLTRRLHDVLGEAAPGLYNAGMMMCGHCKRKMPEVDSDLVLELGISNKKVRVMDDLSSIRDDELDSIGISAILCNFMMYWKLMLPFF